MLQSLPKLKYFRFDIVTRTRVPILSSPPRFLRTSVRGKCQDISWSPSNIFRHPKRSNVSK